ncbi:hypothetical protein ACUH9Y_02120 [Dermabacteraceae bacterium P13115]
MDRDEVFAAQERILRAEREREHAAATALLRDAAASFQRAGIAPAPLRARTFNGRRTIKTQVIGWYLKQDRSVACDREGNFYVMRAEGTLRETLRGARLEPQPAPLVVGKGGRDGEAIALSELITRRLEDPVIS